MYDCVIIGGGIAGLQAAIQLGRYRHHIAVIDSHVGRSLICRSYHNILGWPDGIGGPELRNLGRRQAEQLGVEFVSDEVCTIEHHGEFLRCVGRQNRIYEGKRLLLATGLVDRIPDIPGLSGCLGTTVYVCPDCDGYEITDRRTVVMGAGRVGAEMALVLSYWTKDIIYVNHECTEVDADRLAKLQAKGIEYVAQPVQQVVAKDTQIEQVVLQDQRIIEADRGFVAFGGNEVKSGLAHQLGATLLKNKHIEVDPRTKKTNIDYVWAAGDVTAHSEQVTIAMGDGSQAAIWIHKSLM